MQNLLDVNPVAPLTMRPDTAAEGASTHSTILKAFAVLESLIGRGKPATLAELMQATGMPKASLHRTLSLFEEARLVIRESGRRAYAPGPRLTSLGLEILRERYPAGRPEGFALFFTFANPFLAGVAGG